METKKPDYNECVFITRQQLLKAHIFHTKGKKRLDCTILMLGWPIKLYFHTN